MENEALLSGKSLSLPIILIGGGKLQPIRERILAIIERWSAVISSAVQVVLEVLKALNSLSWNENSMKIQISIQDSISNSIDCKNG